jgi:[acyl-carrier-protein] S-malonyltransferase
MMFPGQGSQYVKMLSEAQMMPAVQDYLTTAKRVLGFDILKICMHGPEADLEETSVCQPAMFIAGMAGIEKMKVEQPEAFNKVGAVAGLSLGEYTALCAAGVFTFEDALELVKTRGQAMSEAAKSPPQAMLSIAGLEREVVDRICEEVSEGDEYAHVANVLFPKGFSCSGSQAAIGKLKDKAMEAQAMQAKLLKTSGAFHTKFMQPAKLTLEEKLEEMLPRMQPPRIPIYMNLTGKRLEAGTPPKEIVPLLADQLVNPVLWNDSVLAMIDYGLTEFYEVGPMKQLKAMMKRINPKQWGNTFNIDV